MRFLFARACVGLLLLLLSPRQEARAATAQLSFSSNGASCPGIRSMRTAVRKRLGYDPFEPTADLHVEVVIVRRAGRLVGAARFERSGAGLGEREMTAEVGACPGLVDSLALAISLALDPDAVDRPRLPRRAPETMSQRSGHTRLTSATLGLRTGEQPSPLESDAGLSRSAEAGLWARLGDGPQDALGLSLGWGVRSANASTGVELRARLPAATETSEVTLTTYGLSLAVRACLEGSGARACLIGEGGAEHAVGRGLSEGAGVWSSAASIGAQIAVEILNEGSWTIEGVSELMAPLIRQAYRSGELELWRSPVVSLGLGLSARWSEP
jgi:hypothetical protein